MTGRPSDVCVLQVAGTGKDGETRMWLASTSSRRAEELVAA
jgi:hypothetical protein